MPSKSGRSRIMLDFSLSGKVIELYLDFICRWGYSSIYKQVNNKEAQIVAISRYLHTKCV